MSDKAIVNIINFIRGVEPRYPSLDLVATLEKEIHLVQSHGLPATWLLQFDALIDPRFVAMMRTLDDQQEIGLWFEVVQPQVERAGLKWRGRPGFSWDWHAHVGFSVGYTPRERELLADVAMSEFKAVFGRYPSSVGSWFMDAHLIGYLHDRYGVLASCNCRDQWGTDGYSMWGGYYSQAYYPSRKNAFVPAQNKAAQIPVPIFRMLGSDPIYQYDAPVGANGQLVITLEPSCELGGGSPEWVRWFFDTMMNSPSLTFGYAQTGQENSFGWEAMQKGLTYQVSLLAELSRVGRLNVETLESSARRYRSMYDVTPASAVTGRSDWKGEGRSSVWYSSRFYRINMFWEDGKFRVRDIRLFDEEYSERYLESVCTSDSSMYDTLPVMDGVLWSDNDTTAAIRIVEISQDGNTQEPTGGRPLVSEVGETLLIEWHTDSGRAIKSMCSPNKWTISVDDGEPWLLEMSWADSITVPIKLVETHELSYEHESFPYKLRCISGEFRQIDDSIRIHPGDDGKIILGFQDFQST
ncbi:MAG TPA: hypothetical protein VGK34_07085 [Armatimonadota bacterium]|jgi:hypothetical protein